LKLKFPDNDSNSYSVRYQITNKAMFHLLLHQLKFVGLDVLQGDKHVGFGYLLPTLTTMLIKLEMLLDRSPRTNVNCLTICEPLVLALKAGIQQRFADVFTNNNAKFASVVISKFKLDWIDHRV
jgi:hypothetical protein